MAGRQKATELLGGDGAERSIAAPLLFQGFLTYQKPALSVELNTSEAAPRSIIAY